MKHSIPQSATVTRSTPPFRRATLVFGMACASTAALFAQSIQTTAATAHTIARDYREGESVIYKMQTTNQGHTRTIRYEARAEAHVKRDPAGNFMEDFAWSGLSFNGQAVTLTPASQQFREGLSLAPGYTLTVPNLADVQPILIGPITDLLTFYADVQLAMRQQGLVHPGDHIYIKHGTPNSWADGTYTTFGQDSIDFDITLAGLDERSQTATLVVRHVPPAQSHIPFPASWMAEPIDGSKPNWAEVEKADGGGYTAETGIETFDSTIVLALPSGRILSSEMKNPVEVVERDCKDATLTDCGVPARYTIERKIAVEAVKP